jgi:hypothetical protein
MRALLTALVSLPLIACAEDDEDAFAPDAGDQLSADQLGELTASDPSHPELAQDVPDATLTRRVLSAAKLVSERSTSNTPHSDLPLLQQQPSPIVDPPKPQAPDSRRPTSRIPHATNTF